MINETKFDRLIIVNNLNKKNKEKKERMDKAKKGTPLLLIALLSVATILVGAALYTFFISGPTTGIYSIETDIRGLDAQLIQAGAWATYNTPTESTTLVDLMFGGTDGELDLREFPGGVPDTEPDSMTSAVLVIHAHDLIDEDLVMTIEVFETGTEQTVAYKGPWTCTPVFAEFYLSTTDYRHIVGYKDNVDGEYFIAPTDNLDRTWTITYAQITDMIYDPTVLVQQTDPSGIGNALVLAFEFPGLDDVEYVEHPNVWDNPPNYSTDISVDVVVTLGTGM